MARPRVIYEAKPGSPLEADRHPLATGRPLGVEIWEPAAEMLTGWAGPPPSDHAGRHGLGRSDSGGREDR
jgi:hypothetical protein